MDLFRTHFQDSARQAAGTFLTPLTNAIAEQRRLVDSLALVSKVRVEECKHMMTWSKYQTEDLGDVLLKLNLLIRKISDYEIRFGNQYEGFREKIKFLRTKDDTLCEMGRRQNDLQTKIVEASKSRLRTAKALLLQKELDKIQKESEPQETQLQTMKRKLIKDAYTAQLDAIIELGIKMQIIGEHGKQLLDHIDLNCCASEYNNGHNTEDILQAARLSLESWDQHIGSTVQPAPVPPVVSLSEAFTEAAATKSNGDSAEASAAAKKAKASVAVTVDTPPLPPRSLDASTSGRSTPDKPQRQKNSASEPEKAKDQRRVASEKDLRHLEELEIKKALELSLAESSTTNAHKGKDLDDLNLSAEELQFVMSGMEQNQTKKDDDDADQNLTAAKTATPPKVVQGAQNETTGHVISQQGPRPWVSVKKPKKPEGDNDAAKDKEDSALEELGDSSEVTETMGESAPEPQTLRRKNTAANYYRALSSMSLELPPGNEPPVVLESMGTEPAADAPPESMGHDDEVPYMAMPVVPQLDEIRREKLQTSQRRGLERQLSSPFPLTPELQYLQIRDSPQVPYQAIPRTPSPPHGSNAQGTASLHMSATHSGPYQGSISSYKPSTTYVPHANKPKNRNSASIVPSPSSSLAHDPEQQNKLANQKAYQLAYQKSYQQYHDNYSSNQSNQQQQQHHGGDSMRSNMIAPPLSPYSAEYQHQQHQQQKQLQDFYYTPGEQAFQQQQYQQYQQRNPGAAPPPKTAWNWGYPVFNEERYPDGYSESSGPSPAPSHISLVGVDGQGASPNVSHQGSNDKDHAYKVEL